MNSRRSVIHQRNLQSQNQQDEEILLEHHIPLSIEQITQSTTEEYNHHLSRLAHLTVEQMNIIKDIRRRGKNKVRQKRNDEQNRFFVSFRSLHKIVENERPLVSKLCSKKSMN